MRRITLQTPTIAANSYLLYFSYRHQQQSALDTKALGISTDAERASFLVAFTKGYRTSVTDSFMPPSALLRQCRYTVSLQQQLAQLSQRSQTEKFIPKSCVADDGSKSVIASRLIVATAHSDRSSITSSGGSSDSSARNTSSLAAKQQLGAKVILTRSEKNRELLAQTRKLSIEHFNWCYYWRSLAFDSQEEAAAEFARILITKEQDLSFFISEKDLQEKLKAAEVTNTSSTNKSNSNDKKAVIEEKKLRILEEAIKNQLKDYAMNGGAVSQGGSWTWLVWNPFTGTSFSSSNRYGLVAEQQEAEKVVTPGAATEEKNKEASSSSVSSEEAVNNSKKSDEDKKTSSSTPENKDDSSDATSDKKTEDATSTTKTPTNPEGKSSEKKKPTATPAAASVIDRKPTTFKLSSVAGRLEVINTPFDVSPLEYGLFPVLCINMTERATLASPTEWASVPIGDTVYAENKIPTWSRAARNSAAINTRAADVRQPGYQAFESIEKQRERFVSGVVNHLHWTNGVKQLEKAMSWNESKQRSDAMFRHAMEIRKRAEVKTREFLDRKIANDPAVAAKEKLEKKAAIAQRELDEQREREELEAKMARDEEEESAKQLETQKEEMIASSPAGQSSATNTTTTPLNTITIPQFTTSFVQVPATCPVKPPTSLEPESSPDGDLTYTLPGNHIFHDNADGSKVVTYSDGTQEWWTSPEELKKTVASGEQGIVVTRVFANGATQYFYDSGSCTLIAVDGTTTQYTGDGELYIAPPAEEGGEGTTTA